MVRSTPASGDDSKDSHLAAMAHTDYRYGMTRLLSWRNFRVRSNGCLAQQTSEGMLRASCCAQRNTRFRGSRKTVRSIIEAPFLFSLRSKTCFRCLNTLYQVVFGTYINEIVALFCLRWLFGAPSGGGYTAAAHERNTLSSSRCASRNWRWSRTC